MVVEKQVADAAGRRVQRLYVLYRHRDHARRRHGDAARGRAARVEHLERIGLAGDGREQAFVDRLDIGTVDDIDTVYREELDAAAELVGSRRCTG